MNKLVTRHINEMINHYVPCMYVYSTSKCALVPHLLISIVMYSHAPPIVFCRCEIEGHTSLLSAQGRVSWHQPRGSESYRGHGRVLESVLRCTGRVQVGCWSCDRSHATPVIVTWPACYCHMTGIWLCIARYWFGLGTYQTCNSVSTCLWPLLLWLHYLHAHAYTHT